jgi:hypothetical protein
MIVSELLRYPAFRGPSSNIINFTKSRRMILRGHAARNVETRNAYKTLVRKPEGKRPFGRTGLMGKVKIVCKCTYLRKQDGRVSIEIISLKIMLINVNLHSGGWSPNWVHSARRPLTGLLYLPRMIVRMENLVE